MTDHARAKAKPALKKFAKYPIGYFYIDIAEVRIGEGKLYLFVAIDRTSKFTYAELLLRYGLTITVGQSVTRQLHPAENQ
jgi:hypothetical protein